MNVKQKFADIKTKIRENRPQIIATVVTAASVIVTIAVLKDANEKLEEAAENLTTSNDALRKANELLRTEKYLGLEKVCISDETKQEIIDGSKDVNFDVDGHRFDLILHTED